VIVPRVRRVTMTPMLTALRSNRCPPQRLSPPPDPSPIKGEGLYPFLALLADEVIE